MMSDENKRCETCAYFDLDHNWEDHGHCCNIDSQYLTGGDEDDMVSIDHTCPQHTPRRETKDER